jgi:hypothetical protein
MGALNPHFVTKHAVLEGLLLIKYGKMVAIATSRGNALRAGRGFGYSRGQLRK